ncbi:MAG: nitroreductase family protein [Ignavibacteriales bacterium]
MDLWDVLEARRTIRSFQDRPVEWPLIEKAIRAAMMAPSHNHLWNWGFILLRDGDFRRRVVDEGFGIQDVKDPVVLSRWVDGLPDEAKRMYLRAVPVQRKMLMTAPEVIVVVYETKKNEAAPRYPSDLNAHAAIWMAIAYLLLSLAEDGLYSCTLPPDETTQAREMLGLPPEWEVAALLPVGYPRVLTRKSGHPSNVDRFIHIDRFAGSTRHGVK